MAIRTIRHCSVSDDIKFLSLVEASTLPVTSVRGMVLVKPTSIAYSGTSASIGTNGQVTFSAVTSLSLNGVFSATYDNYVVVFRHKVATGNASVYMRLRAAGADATGNNYVYQYLDASSTAVTAARATTTGGFIFGAYGAQQDGMTGYIYGPYLAQPTAARMTGAYGYLNAYIFDTANTHSLSTSYDGFTAYPTASSLSGAVQVYGVRG